MSQRLDGWLSGAYTVMALGYLVAGHWVMAALGAAFAVLNWRNKEDK